MMLFSLPYFLTWAEGCVYAVGIKQDSLSVCDLMSLLRSSISLDKGSVSELVCMNVHL